MTGAILPVDGKIILWRKSCDHCAEHLREMAQNDPGDAQILLVQIMDDMDQGEAVDLMPDGGHVTHGQYPEGLDLVLTTPWEIEVQGAMVTKVLGPEDLEDH